MRQNICAILVCLCCLSCCSDAEKLPPPLPEGGAALPYAQVTARLSAQINTAKDAHFLNQWDSLVDTTMQLEQSAGYLMRAPDLTDANKPRVQNETTTLVTNIKQLRESARGKDEAKSLELIRRIHNQVRDLQEMR